jgi:hypothetical protein
MQQNESTHKFHSETLKGKKSLERYRYTMHDNINVQGGRVWAGSIWLTAMSSGRLL